MRASYEDLQDMVKTSVFSYKGNTHLLKCTLNNSVILKGWGGVGNWRKKEKREYWNICEKGLPGDYN